MGQNIIDYIKSYNVLIVWTIISIIITSCNGGIETITPVNLEGEFSSSHSSSNQKLDTESSNDSSLISSSMHSEESMSSSLLSSISEELSSINAIESSSSIFSSSSSSSEPIDIFPKKCSEMYDQTIVPKFEISIDQSSLNSLLACNEIKTYFPAQFNWRKDTIDVMIRQKGNWSWKCEKKQFVISFNENSKGRFKGQRKIVLDAPWYDPTYLNERMSYSIMQDLGEFYSCTNNAQLFINNDFYGLYANIERMDKEYLERHFENPEGNLYESAGELKTNEENPLNESNINGFWNSQSPNEFEKFVDLKQLISQWAAQAFIADSDSWWAGYHINSYVYDIPDSTLVMLPYDMDMGMRFNLEGMRERFNLVGVNNTTYDTITTRDPIYHEHSTHKKESIFKMVLKDSVWCEYFITSLDKHYQNWDDVKFENRYTTYVNQIKAYAHLDPYKLFTSNDFDLHVAQAKHFFKDRAAYIRKWLDRGNHCPAYQ